MSQQDWFASAPLDYEINNGKYCNRHYIDTYSILFCDMVTFNLQKFTFADSIGERAMSAKNSADAEAAKYRVVL